MTRHIILNENTELYSFPEMKSGPYVQTFFRKSNYDYSPVREPMTKHTVCTVHNKTHTTLLISRNVIWTESVTVTILQ